MKQIIKRIVDLAMVVLLPLLMLEILIGQETHEWLGAVMLALFLVHHLLNLGWWRGFAKGKYTPSRAFQTALDLLLLLDMAALGVSGVMMSDFVFRFLGLRGGMMVARQLHLLASYWGLILMSAHLGMHLGQFFPLCRKLFRLSEKNGKRTWFLRTVAAVLSAYGLYAFIDQHIADYLFAQTHFVLFDETKAAAVYFAETVAMMCLFAAAAYYLNKLLRKAGKKSERERSNGPFLKAVAFIIPVLACVLAVAGLNWPSHSEPWQSEPADGPSQPDKPDKPDSATVTADDGFVLIHGGSFSMGSPEDEP